MHLDVETVNRLAFPWIVTSSIFLIHTLCVCISSGSATTASAGLLAAHSVLIFDAYHLAVREKWSWTGAKEFALAIVHCLCFVLAAHDIIRRRREQEQGDRLGMMTRDTRVALYLLV